MPPVKHAKTRQSERTADCREATQSRAKPHEKQGEERAPRSFLVKVMFGGFLLRRIPKPSNSFSISRLCVKGFSASRTIRIKLHVRAQAMTCRPRPFPSLAPKKQTQKHAAHYHPSDAAKRLARGLLRPRTFDDSRQIQQLHLRPFVTKDAGHARQSCKFVRRDFAERP